MCEVHNVTLWFHIDCDKACKGCTADGPDNCVECIDGYKMNDGICSGKYL